MKKFIISIFVILISTLLQAQNHPCSNPVYRQFDFWVGEWEAYGPGDKKAGDSKIRIILDSCIVLEEWTGLPTKGSLRYAGKSFNT